ncbi:unnamed protein product [Arabis nemorensis]|uniref:Uncharacterized protein n=1 Tax=Arabis nemorensis TaxID=586526 RepID=A0A565BGB9_9BRAS|nr:unnamed protein product [Arabis nemorensis]
MEILATVTQDVQKFFTMKLLCRECKAITLIPPKTRLCELAMLQQTYQEALKERANVVKKTAFLIMSNDPFFKVGIVKNLRNLGFTVFTDLFPGMDPQKMTRPRRRM